MLHLQQIFATTNKPHDGLRIYLWKYRGLGKSPMIVSRITSMFSQAFFFSKDRLFWHHHDSRCISRRRTSSRSGHVVYSPRVTLCLPVDNSRTEMRKGGWRTLGFNALPDDRGYSAYPFDPLISCHDWCRVCLPRLQLLD